MRKVYYQDKPVIWPFPNLCFWKDGYFQMRDKFTLSFDALFESEVELITPILISEGIDISFVKDSGADIQIFKVCDNRINEEGYTLEVTPLSIIVKSNTKKGIFYGLNTLIQLLSNSCDKKIPAVSIIDSPFKPVRGVHIFLPPRDQFEWFKRYIDFLAKFKYNTIYIEIGGALKYDSHPEINESWVDFCTEMRSYPGGPDKMQVDFGFKKDSCHTENAGGGCLEKEELSELIEYIRKRHFEIIPEMQSLSHSYWMLLSHRECAERSDDPYPDTYCPSNPQSYKLYFDCLQEVVDLIKPKTVHIGHDEFYSVGICERCKEKTGHEIAAEDLRRIHDWLAERNIKTILWGDSLFDFRTSSEQQEFDSEAERIYFNDKTGKNEIMKATHKAVDMIPNDIVIMDWMHGNIHSQDYFYQRGMEVVLGNFDDMRWSKYGVKNLEERLRKQNVLGVSCSLWHEVSDLGMALKDSLVYYIEVSNIAWYEGYRFNKRYELNNVIAQIYPGERDRLNNTGSLVLDNNGFEFINISDYYNVPLNWIQDLSFITTIDKIPNTAPFDLCRNVKNLKEDPACILVGHEMDEWVDGIKIDAKFRAIVFLHSYTLRLGDIPLNNWSYFDNEEFRVGYYVVMYEDEAKEKIPIEYGKTITCAENEFEAYYANPVYQTTIDEKEILIDPYSKEVSTTHPPYVIFSHEWKNPHPEKRIIGIAIEHDICKIGGILVFGITGIT